MTEMAYDLIAINNIRRDGIYFNITKHNEEFYMKGFALTGDNTFFEFADGFDIATDEHFGLQAVLKKWINLIINKRIYKDFIVNFTPHTLTATLNYDDSQFTYDCCLFQNQQLRVQKFEKYSRAETVHYDNPTLCNFISIPEINKKWDNIFIEKLMPKKDRKKWWRFR